MFAATYSQHSNNIKFLFFMQVLFYFKCVLDINPTTVSRKKEHSTEQEIQSNTKLRAVAFINLH